jgi:hypothetical protein
MNKLAIEGGPKAVTNQLAGWPQFDDKAISAVTEVLKSGKVNYWTGNRWGRGRQEPGVTLTERYCCQV